MKLNENDANGRSGRTLPASSAAVADAERVYGPGGCPTSAIINAGTSVAAPDTTRAAAVGRRASCRGPGTRRASGTGPAAFTS
jgi:hypothetical protein